MNRLPFSKSYRLKPTTKTEKIKTIKLTDMKSVNKYIKWGIMLLFVVFAKCATAQVSPGPYPFTGDDNVCLNQTKSYGVVDVPTSTFDWTITPGVAGTDWILTPTGHNTITVQWLKVGTYTLTVTETNSNGCPSNPVSINITVNPLLTSTQNITVCANQLPYTWLGHVFNGAATITDTVAGNNSCDTIRTLTLAVNPLLTSTQNITVCANQLPYTWLGHVFNGAATITDTVAGNNSCDTIRTLTLAVNPLLTSTQNITVCANQLPYTWLGHVFNGAATITDTVAGNNSCDTIRTLTLAVNPLLTSTQNITVCANQLPYTWLGHVFNGAATITDTVAGNNSCDTIRTLTLAVNPLLTSTQNITVCANQLPYTWLGHVFNGAATITDTVAGNNSCDTIRTLTLAVNPLLTSTQNITVCANQLPYTWLGHVFNGAATITDTVAGNNSCDTIRTLTLAVNPLLTSTQNITVCANQLPYTWLGHVFNGAATITDTVAGNNSCDTIRTLTLAVNPLLTSTQNITVCANQLPYTWLGHVFNGAATITDTVAGNNSCDTIRTLTLAVNPLLTSTQNITVCANQLPYTWLGHVFNGAATITDTVAGNNSCDTIRTLTLAVNPLLTSTQNITVCANQLPYTWLGHVFNGAATITDTVAGNNSCDTIRTLTLAVNPLLTSTQNITVCANQLPYTWLGHVFNGAATITDTVAGNNSCDTIRTLTLAVNPLLTSTQNITVCANQLPYTWLGHVFNGAATITDTVAGNNSCDTIRTLTLAVNPLLTSTQNITVCANQLPYTWLGHVFNGAATITDTVAGNNSCDTIRTLTLAVNPLLTSTQNITVCANQLPYTWLGHVFNGAATITDTVAGNNSCDTIRTLTLAVNPLLTSTQNITVCANQLPYTWLGHVFNGAATITDTVAGNNSCDTIRTLIVNVNPVPVPVVTGPSPVCESINSTVGTYTVPPVAGVTYFWTVSANGTVVSGQGTNSITVQWNTAGPGTVQVTETDTSTGCSGSNVLPVTVNPKPTTTPITHN